MDAHHYEKDGFDKLLNTIKTAGFSEQDIERITEAYHFAEKAHDGQKRRSDQLDGKMIAFAKQKDGEEYGQYRA